MKTSSIAIEATGILTARSPADYVYFIASMCYLYIGITADLPVVRWGSHFQTTGTFLSKLREVAGELGERPIHIRFAAYSIDLTGSGIPLAARGQALRHIEYLVHVLALERRPHLPQPVFVISDVRRTAPRGSLLSSAEEVATAVFDRFILDCEHLREIASEAGICRQ